MLDGHIDGIAQDERAAHQTLDRIPTFTRQEPTIFLPAHDPGAIARFVGLKIVPI